MYCMFRLYTLLRMTTNSKIGFFVVVVSFKMPLFFYIYGIGLYFDVNAS